MGNTMEEENDSVNNAMISVDAEKALIGSVLINPDMFYSVMVDSTDFYIRRHGVIWDAFKKIIKEGTPLDILTVSDELRKVGRDKEVGGITYLSSLVDHIPYSYNAGAYAVIVRDKAMHRKVKVIAEKLVNCAHDERTDWAKELPKITEELVMSAQKPGGAVHIQKYVTELFNEVAEKRANPQEIWGLESGFKDFDRITGGLQKGENMILSGDAGMGKSMFSMQLAVQMAKAGHKGVIYSLEMFGKAVTRRMVSGVKNIPSRLLKKGTLTDAQWDGFMAGCEEINSLPIYLSDSSDWDIISLRADMMRMKMQYDIEWFVLDYLYLLNFGDMDENNSTLLASKGVKSICKTLNLAGIAIHSKSKSGLLRGSGQVRYDADLIIDITKDESDESMRVFTFGKGRELEVDTPRFYMRKLDQFPFFVPASDDKGNKLYQVEAKTKAKSNGGNGGYNGGRLASKLVDFAK